MIIPTKFGARLQKWKNDFYSIGTRKNGFSGYIEFII